MYLIKNFKTHSTDTNEDFLDSPEGRIAYEDYYDLLDFVEHIHNDKKLFLKNVYQRDGTFIPDLAASIFAQMIKIGTIRSSSLKTGIGFCRDLLSGKGYQEIEVRNELLNFLYKNSSPITRNVFLVAGCQGRQMLKDRVDKSFEACREVTKKFKTTSTIVFVGKNPKKPKNRVQYECRRMQRIFSQLLKLNPEIKGKDIPERFVIELEQESGTTKENIKKFFDSSFIKPNLPHNIFIVSSTFHLIRLAEALEEFIEQNKIIKSVEVEINGRKVRKIKTQNIENIILVGAEDESSKFSPSDYYYAKLMMFDIYDTLYRRLKVLDH